MTHAAAVLPFIRRLEAAGDNEERIRVMQDARVMFTTAVEGETKKEGQRWTMCSGGRWQECFLRSYLPPLGAFPHSLLRIVYDVLDGEEDCGMREMADGFFVEVHPAVVVGALASYLASCHEWGRAERHGWRLLGRVMLDGGDQALASVFAEGTWKEIIPEKRWKACCELIVGWIVSITEAAVRSEMTDSLKFLPGSFLPEIARFFMKSAFENSNETERDAFLCLLGVFMKRFLNRGFGKEVVAAVTTQSLLRLRDDGDQVSFFCVVEGIQDAHAMEKFFQFLLVSLPRLADEKGEESATELLRAFSVPHGKQGMHTDAFYALFSRLLLTQQQPRRTVRLLMTLLATDSQKLISVARQVAATWANANAIHHLPLPEQAYLTYVLTLLIPGLPDVFGECGDSRICRLLMEGVSNRLENCIESVRFQGMRVACAIAAREPDSEPLFPDLETDFRSLRREEEWEDASKENKSAEVEGSGMTCTVSTTQTEDVDSDDESDFCNSLDGDDDLEPIEAETEQQTVLMKDQRPVTLMDLHQDLKKTDEHLKLVSALKQLTVLLREHPTELASMASDLGQTLVHVPLPEWIHEELKEEDAFRLKGLKSSSAVRVCCLGILLAEAPVRCGDTIAMMIASKQVAEHHRLEILEAMRQAASELSSYPAVSRITNNLTHNTSEATTGKSHVWGVRSIEASKKGKQPTWRNRFADVAGLWVSSLLLACRTVTHGFSIMDRNQMVLGSMLVTFGTFAQCASQSIVSTSLALTTFPLFRAVLEQKSENCHLRRCSFQALSSIIEAIPIGRISSAMCPSTPVQILDEADEALTHMLAWVRTLAERTMRSDSDETCRHLAAHCFHVGAKASQKALEHQANEFPNMPKQTTIHYKVQGLAHKLPLANTNVSVSKD